MKKLKLWPRLAMLIIMVICFTFSGTVSAFSDVKNDPEKEAIERLQQQGILSGDTSGLFKPAAKLNNASAIALIVNAMDLNLHHIKFVKEPKASDYFTKVKDNVWYSQAFIVALHNSLNLDEALDPAAEVSREQFSHWLFQALSRKGDYAWSEVYKMINDDKSINPAFADSIQKLLISDIAKLDSKQNFRPKDTITRSEAAGMIDRAYQFLSKHNPNEPIEENPYGVSLTSEKVNDDILLVTISATLPHPGYGLEVSSIDFDKKEAVINYRILPPEPGMFYPQVIKEGKATTYVSSRYTPRLGVLESELQLIPPHPNTRSSAPATE
ncbi:S-layer homology domain-containing protein [Paenibacillus marinisediminis]